ncbi:hypothetical protein BSKO_01293 [Bryopsis sp. KO-2023]|nr:hypothetical protein BSKO_01293 [Bryopsis sp. KO-2023]
MRTTWGGFSPRIFAAGTFPYSPPSSLNLRQRHVVSHSLEIIKRGLKSRSRNYSQPRQNGNGNGASKVSWVDPSVEIRNKYEGIFVLAGGFLSDGGLPAWVERRLDASADVQRLQERNCPIVCLGGGTPHKPPILDSRGFVVHESTMCSNYLIANYSINPWSILKEVSSYDTVGNAYFGLAIHALPAKWRKIAVITSDFHMPRSRALFEDMCRLAEDPSGNGNNGFQLDFIPVSDKGIFQEEVLEARKSREAQSLATWKTDLEKLKSFTDLHNWLHETHLCYSVSRQSQFGRQGGVDDLVLNSY